MVSKSTAPWLVDEKVPQVSGELGRRFEDAMRYGGLTRETIAEVDKVIAAATEAIKKHHADEQAALVLREAADQPSR